ncbi:MAG: ubiquinol oxidase subunit II [Syntrophobacteraceae bacterium]
MKGKGNLVFIALSSLGVSTLLGGCGQMVLLHPEGPIGHAERSLIFAALGLMLIVVIPVIIMALWFPRKYSASGNRADYAPKWSSSLKLEVIIWLIPILIVSILGYLAWSRTYQLDPYKPIDSGVKPVTIQVVSLDWKWLFIYPQYNIATVNRLVFPVGVPLSFKITSDTVMNSFFIPQLGSQMYSMAGMVTRLHLLAEKPGVYFGQSQQYSGKGYAYMNFQVRAVSRKDFDAWLQRVQHSPQKLDAARFAQFRKPSVENPVAYFSGVEPKLFDLIVSHYMSMHPGAMSGSPGPMHVTRKAPGGN